MIFLNRNISNRTITKRQGQYIVASLWLVIPFLCSFVYYFSPCGFTFAQSLFESYSGFTTTGATIIKHPEDYPSWLLIYRSFTQWLGGLGFTLIIILLLGKRAANMNNLFHAEFFSLTNLKIYPHLYKTVQVIFIYYTVLTLLCFCALSFQGLNITDALSHAFSTISTGGFSTHTQNIAYFQTSVQWTIMAFMFISGISFFLIVNLFRGRFRPLFTNEQLRYYVILILAVSICFVVYWITKGNTDLVENIKNSLFYSVSIVSSTGYDLQIGNMGEFVTACLVLLMFIGGCSASSSTGLKIIRVLILFRFSRTAATKIFHPRAVVSIRYNKRMVSLEDIRRIFGFFFLYMIVFVFGVFFLCVGGNELSSSIAMSAANLGNIGPAVGEYALNIDYASLNIFSQGVLVVLMLLGRLEIYSFLVIFFRKR